MTSSIAEGEEGSSSLLELIVNSGLAEERKERIDAEPRNLRKLGLPESMTKGRDRILAAIRAEMTAERYAGQLVPVYEDALTAGELKLLLEFYRTPAAQKWLRIVGKSEARR